MLGSQAVESARIRAFTSGGDSSRNRAEVNSPIAAGKLSLNRVT